MTHGGKPVSCPRSPASDTSGSPKALTTPFSDNYPTRVFTCDHQYHPPDCAYRHAAEINPRSLQTADDTAAGAPNNLPASTKVKHFVASLGLRTK